MDGHDAGKVRSDVRGARAFLAALQGPRKNTAKFAAPPFGSWNMETCSFFMREISRPLSHAARFARGSLPPAWLRGMDAATLTLTRVSGPFSVMDGLVEEARETARRLVEPGNRSSVRGGPWCRIAITTNDLIEVEAVAQ